MRSAHGPRVFSANASIYDHRHGTGLAADVVECLASSGELEPGACDLDVGAGTGRVAIAVASMGCETVALDPPLPMLNELRRKASGSQIQVVAGEGARLPFASESILAPSLARDQSRDWPRSVDRGIGGPGYRASKITGSGAPTLY